MLTERKQWVLKPENSLVWHQEVLGWINKYSGIFKAVGEPEEEVRKWVEDVRIAKPTQPSTQYRY
jgi:hypothetical protein